MDSMKASLRLMRSSRSISYWDLGATGMFDGILIDERGAVCGEKPARGRMGCRNVLYGSAGVRGAGELLRTNCRAACGFRLQHGG